MWAVTLTGALCDFCVFFFLQAEKLSNSLVSVSLTLVVCLHRFLLNPAAQTEDHMVQFRFLGILMAVAIRTKKPLDLHLAPWVWKQLCSMPLGGCDLEEVDLLTHRSLQGIIHLENSGITEENFHVVRFSLTFRLSLDVYRDCV